MDRKCYGFLCQTMLVTASQMYTFFVFLCDAGVVNIVQLLSALELSGSLILVELLISIFCREEGQHVHEDAIQDALAAFTKR